MSNRTVTVKLSLEVAAYLANARRAELETKDLKEQIDRLEKAGSGMGRSGLMLMLAGLPGMAAAAGAGVGLASAAVFSGAAAMTALKVATSGVGDAMTAVAEGDTQKLHEAMLGLTVDARDFVREYQRVKPALDSVGDATQSALFGELAGSLTQLTDAYIPVLLRQLPRVAANLGQIGEDFTDWATAPRTVAQVNGQLDLAADLTADFGRMLRAGVGLMLDLADASSDFTRTTVGGLADGVEGLERWVATARATGQINAILDNGARILQRVGAFAAEAGVLLADVLDNPALVDGAEALFNVLGITLDVVQALLNVFEGLPSGVQSGIVTLAVFGGAALMVTGRVLALKASLDSMKVSAVQAGIAAKGVGSMLAGPWGIAIGAATLAVGIFSDEQADAKQQVRDLAGSLDEQTGAITANTRAVVANKLEQDHLLQNFAVLGVEGDRVVDAVLGDAAAMEELNRVVAEGMKLSASDPKWGAAWWIEDWQGGTGALTEYGTKVQEAIAQQQRISGAVGTTNTAVREQTVAIKTLGDELRAQNDPAFALIKAQRDMTEAQNAYTAAVKEHGAGSQQAKDALMTLAQLSIVLADAVGDTSEAFDGKLSPALIATLKAAKLTDKQIADIEKTFKNAKKAGDDFAKDYRTTITIYTPMLDAAIAKMRTLKNLMGSNVAALNEASGSTPTSGRRWGGITEHARDGLLRDAGIYSAAAPARYAFAEPATGGEAFIPRLGDYDKSMSILAQAARWYGASVQPGGSGGGGAAGNSYSRVMNIYPLRANFGTNELRAYEADADAYDRAGRAA